MALDNNHVTKLGELKQLIDGLWSKVTTAISNAVSGLYTKPSGGIPKSDLASGVQTSLGKADTALQSYKEFDPVFSASAAAGITSDDITRWNGKEIVFIAATLDVTYDDVIAIINSGKIPVVRYTYTIGVRTFEKYLFPDYYRDQSTGHAVVFSNVSETAFVSDSSQVEVAVNGGMILTASIARNGYWEITKKSLLVSEGRPTYPAGDETNPIFLNALGEPTPTNWEFHWSSSGKTFNVSELPISRSYLFFNTSTSANASITIKNDLSKSVTVTNINKSGGTSSSATLSVGQSSNLGAVKKCGGMGLVIRQNETSLIIIREI